MMEETTTETATENTVPQESAPEVSTAAPEKEPTGIEGLKAKAKNPGKIQGAVAKPVYTPNYKYSVLKQEHEFEDWAKKVIKDKETEDNLRKLYTERAGLEHIKAKRDELETKSQTVEKELTEVKSSLAALGEYAKKGDYDSFFEALGIPNQQILQYAIELAKREQWTPEQKAQHQAQKDAQVHKSMLQQQSEELEHRQRQLELRDREFELRQVLSAPQALEAANSYDTALAKPGAFRDFVIQIGASYAARGIDIPAQQAVSEALQHLQAFRGQTMQQANTPPPQVAVPNNKPTIPSVSGRGTSPVKKAFSSLEELKKYGRELAAQQS